MLRKRFQVFVSSTYEDLRKERQAAVEAILKAGHIPAGMELFTAGDKSQMDVIRRWIDDSDIFMLILGARYGSIESSTGKSYVELEFEYALQTGKPFFSVVISEVGREAKVHEQGTGVLEAKNESAYRDFRNRITSHLCAFFATPVDVKLAVFETLPQIAAGHDLVGWISAADAQAPEDVLKELAKLAQENGALRVENQTLRSRVHTAAGEAPSFDDLFKLLQQHEVTIPQKYIGAEEDVRTNLLKAALAFADDLVAGVTNAYGSSEHEAYVFYNIASLLGTYGFVEQGKSPTTAKWTRLVLTKSGAQFLTKARVRLGKGTSAPEPQSTQHDAQPPAAQEREKKATKRAAKKK